MFQNQVIVRAPIKASSLVVGRRRQKGQNLEIAFRLTLFIMSELIIDSKLATAGPGHFKLQKYPPKENYIKK